MHIFDVDRTFFLVSSTCGVFAYLKIVSPSDHGEVDAEHYDKDQQADQQKQPMLTSKLDTWNIWGKNLLQDFSLVYICWLLEYSQGSSWYLSKIDLLLRHLLSASYAGNRMKIFSKDEIISRLSNNSEITWDSLSKYWSYNFIMRYCRKYVKIWTFYSKRQFLALIHRYLWTHCIFF